MRSLLRFEAITCRVELQLGWFSNRFLEEVFEQNSWLDNRLLSLLLSLLLGFICLGFHRLLGIWLCFLYFAFFLFGMILLKRDIS
jgi:hypothetical protein